MKKQKFPVGWDEARVQRLIDHYENMTVDAMIAEDEAAREAGTNHLPVQAAATETNGAQRKKKRKPTKADPRPKRRSPKA